MGEIAPGTSAPARRLLFRSYLFLAGGLLAVAVLLELVFAQLQSRHARVQDPWLATTIHLLESRLSEVPPAERQRTAISIGESLGTPVSLLDSRDVVAPTAGTDALKFVVDDAGREHYLFRSRVLDQVIRLGPIAPPPRSAALSLLPLLFYLSIFVVVGLWLRPLLRDVRLLTTAAQSFAANYRTPLDTARSTTQLTSLARNLDDMSQRIGSLIRNQRDLTAALSHEMRTPLARIRFALAVLQNPDDADVPAQLAALNTDVQEIDRLIATLLNYVRLDHPDVRMNWQLTPIEPWLDQALRRAESPARSIAISRHTDIAAAPMDARLMELALSNLIVNASRYAHARVAIEVAQATTDYYLSVDDDGPGVPEADREHVFRAFARLDTSRNRDTGGYGLGLAIVARIATLHGGRAEVTTSPSLGGARFSLRWPATAAAGPTDSTI
jgi:signal transduction histidine kinase